MVMPPGINFRFSGKGGADMSCPAVLFNMFPAEGERWASHLPRRHRHYQPLAHKHLQTLF